MRYLSPFRYPGGKNWAVQYVRCWLQSLDADVVSGSEFVEPFAGGASVGLAIAQEHIAHHVTLVELDDAVAAVWQTILNGDWHWLCQRIRNFQMSAQAVKDELSIEPTSTQHQAFQTILRNRVNYGGKITKDAGMLKEGEDGKGIGSRWYPAELETRIRIVASLHSRITFIHADGIHEMASRQNHPDNLYFIDPPYTAGGRNPGARQYGHTVIDHRALFDLVATLGNRFLMTYDDSDPIRALAETHGLQVQSVTIQTNRNAAAKELFIGQDLAWLVQYLEAQVQQRELELLDE